jgi:hypothetical protein
MVWAMKFVRGLELGVQASFCRDGSFKIQFLLRCFTFDSVAILYVMVNSEDTSIPFSSWLPLRDHGSSCNLALDAIR